MYQCLKGTINFIEMFLLNKETLLTLVYQIIANDWAQIICLSEVSAIIDRRAVDVLSTILTKKNQTKSTALVKMAH